MLIEPVRYRYRPPEIDALEVALDIAPVALGWLADHGRDAYITDEGIRVVEHPDGSPAFDVPWGTCLVRDVRSGAWAPVPRDTLDREYVSAREDDRRRAGRGYM